MSMFQETRAAKNQSLFREVNERVKEVNANFNILLEISDWLCECASETCTQRIAMTPQEYEAVRSEGNRFAVAATEEHVIPEVEQVTERHERYWVVEKTGRRGEIAAGLDPRSPSREAGAISSGEREG